MKVQSVLFYLKMLFLNVNLEFQLMQLVVLIKDGCEFDCTSTAAASDTIASDIVQSTSSKVFFFVVG